MILTQIAASQSGMTLLELLATLTLVVALVSISLPTVASEMDALRLRSASQATVATLDAALMTAARRQEPVEITIAANQRTISTRSLATNSTICLDLPEGIIITSDSGEDTFIIYPDGDIPAINVSLKNQKGVERKVWVNPASGIVHEKAI